MNYVFNAYKVIVNIFQSQQLLSESQHEDLNFYLVQEPSRLKQMDPLTFPVETVS
jgi:hypothetical protein